MSNGVGVYEGSVLWFNVIRGFGFIKCDAFGKDVFFHASGVTQDGSPPLRSGERVTFTVTHLSDGSRAVNVSRIAKSKGADNGNQKN